MEPSSGALASIVALALAEDVGPGDETTNAVVPAATFGVATIVSRSGGVLSGMAPARETARQVDPEVEFEAQAEDGESLAPGQVVAVLRGHARSLLTMERTLLNFLQQLSGVATLTARFVLAVEGTGVTIVDTRKTTPGLRFLEKAAVRHGGGRNHRFGLYDACMIKDNHIAAAGGITSAVERMRRAFYEQGRELWLTVEAGSIEEAEEAARLGVDQILLDNMDPESIRAAVDAIRRLEEGMAEWARRSGANVEPHRARIEVSGGVTLETVRKKALAGVDFISVGALTHSAPALDLALDLVLAPVESTELVPEGGVTGGGTNDETATAKDADGEPASDQDRNGGERERSGEGDGPAGGPGG